jgi:hypothetical protein
LTASSDKLKILGRGNFLMRLDDTKDMVVQALVAQITVDGIIGLDCWRSNAVFFKNVSFASTNISVSYVSLFAESSTAPLIIISL